MTRVKILRTKDFDTKFKAKGNFQVDLPPSTYSFPLKPKAVKKSHLEYIPIAAYTHEQMGIFLVDAVANDTIQKVCNGIGIPRVRHSAIKKNATVTTR